MTARQKISRRQSNRREQLLEAAARRFLQHGYAAASMRDIAADAGMQPGSIYYHFPSKAELLVAVHEECLQRITRTVVDAIADIQEPWARLEAACIAHLRILLEGGDFFQAVMQEMPRESQPARRRIARMRDRYERIFTELLADLRLPRGVDRHDLRLMLLGALNWSHSWYRPGAESPDIIARKYVGFLREKLDIEC